MQLHLSALAAALVALVATKHASAVFTDSCHDLSVSVDGSNVLQASCLNKAGKVQKTTLDINKCVVNFDGNLACAGVDGTCNPTTSASPTGYRTLRL